jgi:hypothetical protein
MFTVVYSVLVVAAIAGCFLFLFGCALLLARKFRPLAIAVLLGGCVGALVAICLLAYFSFTIGLGTEFFFTDVNAMLGAVGFAIGGGFGAASVFLVTLLRPNRSAIQNAVNPAA